MNTKMIYYLRGIAIGVALTALITGISYANKEVTLSDAEVKARAKALGMVENTYLSDADNQIKLESDQLEPDKLESDQLESDQLESDKVEEDRIEAVNDAGAENVVEEPINKDKPQQLEETVDEIEEGTLQLGIDKAEIQEDVEKLAIIEVKSGETSQSVSRKMKEVGLIDDAKAFDEFLCKNGYDKKIATGKHEISYQATQEEMAISLTKK